MYMSYCRYEGTYAELRVCLSDVEEHANKEAEFEVSDHEIAEFRQMVYRFHEFLCDQELLDEYGNLNEEKLEDVCEAMSKRYDFEDEECW